MSNMSGLPPAFVVRAAAMASLQEIAVRLVSLPDDLSNNRHPVKLSGTVVGQTREGHVQLQTNRGLVTMLLKDKANLPLGQTFDIEIPAGRNPQQASLRAPSNTNQTSQPNPAQPNLAGTLPPVIGSTIRIDRPPGFNPNELSDAIAALKAGSEIPNTAPLQAGQTLRLIPLPLFNQSTQSQIQIPSNLPADTQEIFTALVKMLSQASDLPMQTRQAIAQILNNVDPAIFVKVQSQQTPLAAQNTTQDQPEVILQKLMQALDLPASARIGNGSSQNMQTPIFNPTKPLDVQILAFPAGNFSASLQQAQTGQPLPPLMTQNMMQNMVIVQPQGQPATMATPITTPTTGTILPPSAEGSPLPASPTQTPPIAQPAIPTSASTVPATPVPASGSPTLIGQVTGFTPQGLPILSLPLPGYPQPQNYVVQFVPNNITQGAPVLMSPLQHSTPTLSAGIVPFGIGPNTSLQGWAQPETWDSLQILISQMAQLNPSLAQSLTQMMPNPAQPQTMGALSLFFLAVMRSGDFDSWIGSPTLELLKQSGKLDIIRSLSGETSAHNRLETTTLPNDWRATMLPFWHNQHIQKLPLYYKQWSDEENNADENRRKKLRFLFALNLSRMGEVQVDGFMQKDKLDMILRTKSAISANMQQAMKSIYHKSMERSNLSGEISFQFKPEQWVAFDLADAMPMGQP